jgi:hypothetical protein
MSHCGLLFVCLRVFLCSGPIGGVLCAALNEPSHVSVFTTTKWCAVCCIKWTFTCVLCSMPTSGAQCAICCIRWTSYQVFIRRRASILECLNRSNGRTLLIMLHNTALHLYFCSIQLLELIVYYIYICFLLPFCVYIYIYIYTEWKEETAHACIILVDWPPRKWPLE